MENLINTKLYLLLWILCLLAIGSFFLTINLPLIGEEGVYTNAALEMIFAKQYKFATLYGNIYPRPPLYNWLIILFSKIFGAKNIVLSARMVAISATASMAITVFYTTKHLFRFHLNHHNQHIPSHKSADKKILILALLSTAIFLSGDVLFKRGWLAYSDPIFAMFVFDGMVLLLLGTINNNLWLIVLANICIFLGFLCKVHTAYIFYAITLLVLLCSRYNKYLLQPKIMFLHILFIIPLILWNYNYQESDCFFTIFNHIKKLTGISHNDEGNLLRNVISFPIQIVVALLPGSLITIFAAKKLFDNKYNMDYIIKILLLITILNFIPYWIASQTNIRYLLPIYPCFAIIITYIIWQANYIKQTIVLLFIGVLIKYFVAIFWFPYQYAVKHGNATLVAEDILLHTNQDPLYIHAFSATGLRIAGAINKMNWPGKPLQEKIPTTGAYFMIQENKLTDLQVNLKNVVFIKSYKLNKDHIFLYWYN